MAYFSTQEKIVKKYTTSCKWTGIQDVSLITLKCRAGTTLTVYQTKKHLVSQH